MDKREKVIKGLECCTQHGSMCGRDCNGYWGWVDDSHTSMELLGEYRTKCTYGNCETGCVKTLAKDALALLKAQEPTKFQIKHAISNTDIPKGMNELDYLELMSKIYAALAKLYGEEPVTYGPSKEDDNG